MLPVVEHGCIDKPRSFIGKRLKILIMRCYHPKGPFLIKLFEDSLRYCATNLRFRSGAHFIGKE